MTIGFDTFNAKTNTYFTIKNISSDRKTISIFKSRIIYGQELDLMSLPYVSEADIRNSLLKGVLLSKLRLNQIQVVNCTIDLTQYDSEQRAFLQQYGVGDSTTSPQIVYDEDNNPVVSNGIQFEGNGVQTEMQNGRMVVTVSGSGGIDPDNFQEMSILASVSNRDLANIEKFAMFGNRVVLANEYLRVVNPFTMEYISELNLEEALLNQFDVDISLDGESYADIQVFGNYAVLLTGWSHRVIVVDLVNLQITGYLNLSDDEENEYFSTRKVIQDNDGRLWLATLSSNDYLTVFMTTNTDWQTNISIQNTIHTDINRELIDMVYDPLYSRIWISFDIRYGYINTQTEDIQLVNIQNNYYEWQAMPLIFDDYVFFFSGDRVFVYDRGSFSSESSPLYQFSSPAYNGGREFIITSAVYDADNDRIIASYENDDYSDRSRIYFIRPDGTWAEGVYFDDYQNLGGFEYPQKMYYNSGYIYFTTPNADSLNLNGLVVYNIENETFDVVFTGLKEIRSFKAGGDMGIREEPIFEGQTYLETKSGLLYVVHKDEWSVANSSYISFIENYTNVLASGEEIVSFSADTENPIDNDSYYGLSDYFPLRNIQAVLTNNNMGWLQIYYSGTGIDDYFKEGSVYCNGNGTFQGNLALKSISRIWSDYPIDANISIQIGNGIGMANRAYGIDAIFRDGVRVNSYGSDSWNGTFILNNSSDIPNGSRSYSIRYYTRFPTNWNYDD